MPRRAFPPGFFDRADPTRSGLLCLRAARHPLDDGAIATVGDLYDELRLTGIVLDPMGSWVSHFHMYVLE